MKHWFVCAICMILWNFWFMRKQIFWQLLNVKIWVHFKFKRGQVSKVKVYLHTYGWHQLNHALGKLHLLFYIPLSPWIKIYSWILQCNWDASTKDNWSASLYQETQCNLRLGTTNFDQRGKWSYSKNHTQTTEHFAICKLTDSHLTRKLKHTSFN